LSSNFGSNKDILTIFGTEIKNNIDSEVYFSITLTFLTKICVKNLGRTIILACPQWKTAVSFSYVKITPSQSKVRTIIVLD